MRLKSLIVDTCDIFNKLRTEYALIGGYSAMVYGSPYITSDIDFILSKDKVNLNLVRELEKIGWRSTERYESINELQAFGQFAHKDLGVILHIFTEVGGFKLKPGIKINEIEFLDRIIKVCSPEDYLIMRAYTFDEEDKLRAIVLLKAQEKNLDMKYLIKRAKEEGVKERIEWLLKYAKKKRKWKN